MKQKIIDEIIDKFEQEFYFLMNRFEIIDLLANSTPMDREIINGLKLPSEFNNLVWRPGVYLFIGNNEIYKVGVSMINSRRRVIEHLDDNTSRNGISVWDINNYNDKSILLFNIKEDKDKHWLLALEAFFETTFTPKIPAGRIG